MRTNIEIDDKLMKKAMKASKLETKTKRAVVEEALGLMVQIRDRAEGLRRLREKVKFDPAFDYKALREDDRLEINVAPAALARLQPATGERRRKKAA